MTNFTQTELCLLLSLVRNEIGECSADARAANSMASRKGWEGRIGRLREVETKLEALWNADSARSLTG